MRLPDLRRCDGLDPGAPAAADDSQLHAYAEACQRRYEANPGEKSASIAYARALRVLTRYREAAAVMQTAAVKAPKDETILGEYGKALADAGELAQAKDVLTRAYTPDDPKWDIMSVQGAVADQLGDHASAMQFYRDALKIAPGEPGVLANMGLSLALSRQLPEAERALREAVASPKADARMRGDLALVLALEGKFADAERVGLTDLPSEAARANVEAIRQMLAAGNLRPANRRRAGRTTPAEAQSSRSPIDDVGRGSRLGPAPGGRIGGAGSSSATGGGSAPFGPSRGPVNDIGARATALLAWAPTRATSSGSSISGAGGRPSGAAGGGRRLGCGRRPADAARAGVGRPVVGEIEVDVIVVEDVRARPEHRGEVSAGPRMRLVQERGLLRAGLFPIAHEFDRAPVGQGESCDVDGVAEGVFGEPLAGHVVDRPAAVGAEHVERRHSLAEARLCVRLDDVLEPGLERRDHRTIDGQHFVDPDRPRGEGRDLQRPRHAADARPVDLGGGGDRVGQGDELAGEAGVLRLGAPDRPLRTAEEAAASHRQSGDQRHNERPNATRH